MGLAERFKTKLEKKNIFEKDIIEQKLEENDIKFISKPEMIDLKNSTIQTPIIVNTDLNVSENQEEKMLSPDKLFLEDLENELINKIRKTPYWDDFSNERKTDMIANYFDNKLKKNKYFKFSQSKKDNFVQTVLVLSNNRYQTKTEVIDASVLLIVF